MSGPTCARRSARASGALLSAARDPTRYPGSPPRRELTHGSRIGGGAAHSELKGLGPRGPRPQVSAERPRCRPRAERSGLPGVVARVRVMPDRLDSILAVRPVLMHVLAYGVPAAHEDPWPCSEVPQLRMQPSDVMARKLAVLPERVFHVRRHGLVPVVDQVGHVRALRRGAVQAWARRPSFAESRSKSGPATGIVPPVAGFQPIGDDLARQCPRVGVHAPGSILTHAHRPGVGAAGQLQTAQLAVPLAWAAILSRKYLSPSGRVIHWLFIAIRASIPIVCKFAEQFVRVLRRPKHFVVAAVRQPGTRTASLLNRREFD